ncbi:ISAs1 family transposase [Actinophytocola sp.]|uniref:ISAs1 family transposase n=1 Tax=Actinophytocola sp. TaxID=1872138 RepID=UPI002D8080C9|nr:ISAs1 family transposase [Actinophytocola sp.]HET9138761.1 ISAs1 family transposase [Actinophytocola sp.]
MSSSLIDAVRLHPAAGIDVATDLAETTPHDLLQALAGVPDPRRRRGVRYRLASLLAVAVCAVLAGATTFAAIADWAADLDEPARHRLGLAGRIPAGSTVWRFLVRVDAHVLQAVLTGWLRRRLPARPAARPRHGRVVIAVDGKTLRGARLADGRQVHLLCAYDTATGIVLAQVAVAAKSNEIPAFTPLLEQLQAQLGSLAGTIIVADALHAQVGHAHAVTARGGQLMVTIKANQPTLHALLKRLPWARVPVGHQSRERGHGRSETRTVKALTVLTPGGLGFPHAQQAVRLTRTRTTSGTTSRETAYLITTLPAGHAQPEQLGDWTRREWHIENRLHWIRDVTFAEDAHQARTGNGPAVAAVLRNTAIGYHRSNGEANIARATRRANRRPHDLINAVTSTTRTQ